MHHILAQNLTTGMNVVNLGIITSIEKEESAKLIRVVFMNSKCLSCAFSYYRFDTVIYIHVLKY
jgi:hypothetical protein